MDLKERQWEVIRSFFPVKKSGSRGRPPADVRKVVNGILWICRTGAPWMDLPRRYPPYQTCHRYFQKWNESGLWDRVLKKLADDLYEEGKIDIRECFIDGTFASAKKGRLCWEN